MKDVLRILGFLVFVALSAQAVSTIDGFLFGVEPLLDGAGRFQRDGYFFLSTTRWLLLLVAWMLLFPQRTIVTIDRILRKLGVESVSIEWRNEDFGKKDGNQEEEQ